MIDVDETLERLQAAVNERGEDFVYADAFDKRQLGYSSVCDYVEMDKADTPGCIIGLAFWDVLDDNYIFEGFNGPAEDALYDELTDGAKVVVAAAQSVQDHNGTWGLALAAAKRIGYLVKDLTTS